MRQAPRRCSAHRAVRSSCNPAYSQGKTRWVEGRLAFPASCSHLLMVSPLFSVGLAATLQLLTTVSALSHWLEAAGLGEHRPAFERLGLSADAAHLRDVDDDDIQALAQPMKKYERKRFLEAVEVARSTPMASIAPGRALQTNPVASTHAEYATLLKSWLMDGQGTGISYDKTVPPVLAAGEVRAVPGRQPNHLRA